MNPTAALAPLVVVAALILWVYVDARRHQVQGHEVVARIGSVQVVSRSGGSPVAYCCSS